MDTSETLLKTHLFLRKPVKSEFRQRRHSACVYEQRVRKNLSKVSQSAGQ